MAAKHLKGVLFKRKVIRIINAYKKAGVPIALECGFKLRVPKFSDKEIKLLTGWRNKNCRVYPTQFSATPKSTKSWLRKLVMERQDRILFMIEAPDAEIIGHLGISNMDFKKKVCELDNVIRGIKNKYPGVMTRAVKAVLEFGFNCLAMDSFILRVFSENTKAIRFYRRCGFRIAKKIPLKRTKENNTIKYIEADKWFLLRPDKVFVMMQKDKKDEKAR